MGGQGMSILGLDVGTTGAKAVVFRENGEVIGKSYREYPLYMPRVDMCEINPGEVWKAVAQVISAAVKQAGSRDPVSAVGISTLGDSVTPVDKNGNFLVNTVIGAADRRALQQTRWIEGRFTREELFEKSGAPLHAFCTIPKVMWFREERPDVYEQTWKFTGWQEIAHLKMGLEPVMDYSLASHTMLMDIKGKTYFEKLFKACDLSADLFFQLASSDRIVGRLSAKSAGLFGLATGTAVVAGGFDQSCCALGSGLLDSESVAISVGTLEGITAITDSFRPDRMLLEGNHGLGYYVIDGLYSTLAYVTTSGAILRWYRDTLGALEVQEANSRGKSPYEVMIESTPDRPSGVFVLPYFAGSGTPWLDTNQRGTVFGLTLDTDRSEILKGILDCICYEVRVNLESLSSAGFQMKKIRAVGGGTRSARWMQLKADITGLPVETTNVAEAGCLGAAFLAGLGTGIFSSPEDILDITKIRYVYEPRTAKKQSYDDAYRKYCELRRVVKGLVLD